MSDVGDRIVVAQQLGANVRHLRVGAELSRDELAIGADVGHGHLSKIETGGLLCRVDTLVKLAAALKVTPNDLLAGIDWRSHGSHGGGFETRSTGGVGDAGGGA